MDKDIQNIVMNEDIKNSTVSVFHNIETTKDNEYIKNDTSSGFQKVDTMSDIPKMIDDEKFDNKNYDDCDDDDTEDTDDTDDENEVEMEIHNSMNEDKNRHVENDTSSDFHKAGSIISLSNNEYENEINEINVEIQKNKEYEKNMKQRLIEREKNWEIKNLKFQNKKWEALKKFLEKIIEENNISYGLFMELSQGDNYYMTPYQLEKLKESDNYLNFSEPSRTENKLYTLIETFKNQYENDIEYKKMFDIKISNLTIKSIYKSKIYELYYVFYPIGLSIRKIKYSSIMSIPTLRLEVDVNISVFKKSLYGYEISKNSNIIEKNKLVLKTIIIEKLKEFKIIDDNVNIDVYSIVESKYL